jgi:glycosyltransferase involved in cell wall biosynthesis
VFEHIDELEVFTAAHRIEDLRRWYEEAVREAELVVGTAYDLVDKVKEVRPDAIICPNGVDYRHFANFEPGPPPEDIADIAGGDRPIVGYYGAIAEWVDFDLIAHAADALPEFEFVFIGPEYDASVKQHLHVFDRPNVRWLGVKDYAELPAYLHAFDIATIPFLVNEVTHAVSPLKLFEYFAGERPVVTPALRECARYEAVQVAQDADDYVEKLRLAARLRHDPEHLALLRRTARANTWEMRAGTLVDALARSRSAVG